MLQANVAPQTAQAQQQSQLTETSLRAELAEAKVNQMSAQDSLKQAELSIDALQQELGVLQKSCDSPGSLSCAEAPSQQVPIASSSAACGWS